MSDGGKGSSPRPYSVSHEEWTNRWDAIFGKDLKDKESELKNNSDKLINQPDENIRDN